MDPVLTWIDAAFQRLPHAVLQRASEAALTQARRSVGGLLKLHWLPVGVRKDHRGREGEGEREQEGRREWERDRERGGEGEGRERVSERNNEVYSPSKINNENVIGSSAKTQNFPHLWSSVFMFCRGDRKRRERGEGRG